MSLLDFFELLPLPALFIATFALGAVVGAVVLVAVRTTVRLLGIAPTQALPVRDALISSLSAIFALMVAFSAAGIWNDSVQARAAVQREANAIESVVALSANFPEQLREEIRSEILRYGRRTVESDWPAMRHRAGVNETIYDRSNSPLVALITDISRESGTAGSPPLSGRLVDQILDLRGARLQREMIARGGVSPAQWLAMLLLATGALTMIAIAHNHQFGLQLTTMSVYTVGASAAFFVILAHDRPFAGPLGVKPTPIEQAIERLQRSQNKHAFVPAAVQAAPVH
jgi:hypothetical protein